MSAIEIFITGNISVNYRVNIFYVSPNALAWFNLNRYKIA